MTEETHQPTRDERRRAAREERKAAELAVARADARRKRLLQLGGVVAAAVAIVVAVVVIASGSGGSKAKPSASGAPAGAAQVNAMFRGIPQSGTTVGKPGAPVTLVEFADLKCPICRQYSSDVLPTLVKDYVRSGRLRIVFRAQHFVGEQLNPGDSLAAARMALAAGQQNRLWQFAELFYVNQQDEQTRYVSDSYLRRIGSAVDGLDVAKALAFRPSPEITQQLQQASSQFTSSGFTGTPSFLIGRTGSTPDPLQFSQLTPDEFTRAIDALLS